MLDPTGLTDLVESSEDIMRSLNSIFQKIWKVFVKMFNIYFSLRSNGRNTTAANCCKNNVLSFAVNLSE